MTALPSLPYTVLFSKVKLKYALIVGRAMTGRHRELVTRIRHVSALYHSQETLTVKIMRLEMNEGNTVNFTKFTYLDSRICATQILRGLV